MAIQQKISKEDYDLYMSRKLSAKNLAEKYGVCRNYIYQTLPRGKRPESERQQPKMPLIKTRRAFRDNLARQIGPTLSVKDAANIAHCSVRTMYRHLEKVKNES